MNFEAHWIQSGWMLRHVDVLFQHLKRKFDLERVNKQVLVWEPEYYLHDIEEEVLQKL